MVYGSDVSDSKGAPLAYQSRLLKNQFIDCLLLKTGVSPKYIVLSKFRFLQSFLKASPRKMSRSLSKRSTACFASPTSRTASSATDSQSTLCARYSVLRRLGRQKHELLDLESGGHFQPNQDPGPVRHRCDGSGYRRVRLVGLDNAADNRSR
jgi:hypothetical protein